MFAYDCRLVLFNHTARADISYSRRSTAVNRVSDHRPLHLLGTLDCCNVTSEINASRSRSSRLFRRRIESISDSRQYDSRGSTAQGPRCNSCFEEARNPTTLQLLQMDGAWCLMLLYPASSLYASEAQQLQPGLEPAHSPFSPHLAQHAEDYKVRAYLFGVSGRPGV